MHNIDKYLFKNYLIAFSFGQLAFFIVWLSEFLVIFVYIKFIINFLKREKKKQQKNETGRKRCQVNLSASHFNIVCFLGILCETKSKKKKWNHWTKFKIAVGIIRVFFVSFMLFLRNCLKIALKNTENLMLIRCCCCCIFLFFGIRAFLKPLTSCISQIYVHKKPNLNVIFQMNSTKMHMFF